MSGALPLVGLGAGVCAAVISFVLTPVSGRLGAMLGLMDAPDSERKTHAAVTPRSGGLAVGIAFFGTLVIGALAGPIGARMMGIDPDGSIGALVGNWRAVSVPILSLLLGALAMWVLGLLDDRFHLAAMPKLIVQLLAAAGLYVGGVKAQAFLPDVVALAATIAWTVVITNAFNLLDNMDGLSSGIATLTAFAFGVLAWMSSEWMVMGAWCALGGACLGFWRWNFFRGTPFLGDGGALLIGFLFAGLSLRSTYFQPGVPSGLPVLCPLILLALPLFDTATVVYIRWKEGRPLMKGDRCHFSHRLEAIGFTRRRAVMAHYLVVCILALAAWTLRFLPTGPAVAQVVLVGLLFLFLFMVERAAAKKMLNRMANGE